MTKIYWLFLLFGLTIILPACQENQSQQKASQNFQSSRPMRVTILNKILYPNIPSASGMEIMGNLVYIVSDDSPLIYVLDVKTLRLVKTIPLFKSEYFKSGRIPKALKPDLESLTTLPVAGTTQLIAFGSGSAPTRTKCYTIKLPDTPAAAAEVKEYSLEKFYLALQQDTALVTGDLLNLEGAAVTSDNDLLLLQRSALAGPNAIVQFNAFAFAQYLTQQSALLPSYTIYPFELPELAGSRSRFSGAYTFADNLFFTASVENTTNAIDDGEVLGSFVGCLPLAAITKPAAAQALQTALITTENGQPYRGKVESLVILEQENQHTYQGLAITDNDNGQSELLQIRIEL